MNDRPRATYRVQLHKGFGFRDAAALVDYWRALGISHLYVSPVLQAAPGSTHGYDVVDATKVNEELGGEAALVELAQRLHESGMGLIVDFVPNHMGVAAGGNAFWTDVLENGPSSLYSDYFDIDWQRPKESLRNKLLLPILGDQYGVVLERGEIGIVREGGRFFLTYYDRRLPVAPRSLRSVVDDALRRLDLPENHDGRLELESIRTAIEHLPATDDTEDTKRQERAREKEIIKRRIAKLTEEEPSVGHALDEALLQLRGTPGKPATWDALDALISAQPYRLSSWRLAFESINYRRFFDINELAAIRMEDTRVFEVMHQALLRLVREGVVDGVRLDHTDGLYDPPGYFASLAQALSQATAARGETNENPVYVVAEKIVGPQEPIPPGWRIDGTTGYDFTRAAIGVLVDPAAEATLTELHEKMTGDDTSFEEHCVRAKREIMYQVLASEISVLARRLERIAESRRSSRDFTTYSLATALVETIASFGVYRTYVRPDGSRTSSDDEHLHRAVRAARRRNPNIDGSVFSFVEAVLALRSPFDDADCVELAMKVQQVTGPVMAKAVEDTVFYRYPRLVAENDVGCHPSHLGVSVDELHRQNEARLSRFPFAMTATATHDTKLGEDVRARIAVLSEIPREFAEAVARWDELAAKHMATREGERIPAGMDRLRLYQVAYGFWPLDEASADREALAERFVAYATKAAREAKTYTSWLDPDQEYEAALTQLAKALFTDEALSRDVRELVGRTAVHGASNALAQLVLRLTSPGVPDTFQGSELWHEVLVDPDNRRPVDYGTRRAALERVLDDREAPDAKARGLLERFESGGLKMLVLARVLALRARCPALFARGDYVPLAGGPHAIAYLRAEGSRAVLVCVPRLPYKLTGGAPRFPVGDVFGDERLQGRGLANGRTFRDVLTGRKVTARDGVALRELLADLPVAVAEAEA